MFCRNCGKKNTKESKFCIFCGTKLIKARNKLKTTKKLTIRLKDIKNKLNILIKPKVRKKEFYISPNHRHLPIIRLLARFVDYMLLSALIGELLAILIYLSPNTTTATSIDWLIILNNRTTTILIGLFIFILWIPIETILQFWFKTTPGKFLFQLELQSIDKTKPSFKQLLKRSFLAWGQGLWAGFFSFIPMFIQGRRLANNTSTTYDKESGFIVVQKKINPAYIVLMTMVAIAILAYFYSSNQTYSKINTPEQALNQLLIETSLELNETLPVMVDNETQLISTTSFGNEFIYNYKYIGTEILSQHDFDNSKTVLAEDICTDSDTRDLLDSGVILTYNYFDNYKSIGKISIDLSDCK